MNTYLFDHNGNQIRTQRGKCGFFCRLKRLARAVLTVVPFGNVVLALVDLAFTNDTPQKFTGTGEDALSSKDKTAIELWHLQKFSPAYDNLLVRGDTLLSKTSNKIAFAESANRIHRAIETIKQYLVFTSAHGESGFTALALSERNRFALTYLTELEKTLQVNINKARIPGIMTSSEQFTVSDLSSFKTLSMNWQGKTINASHRVYGFEAGTNDLPIDPIEPTLPDGTSPANPKGRKITLGNAVLDLAVLTGLGLVMKKALSRKSNKKKK